MALNQLLEVPVSTFHSGVWSSNGKTRKFTPATVSEVRNPESAQASVTANGETIEAGPPVAGELDERVRQVLEIVESGTSCTIRSLARQFKLTHFHLLHLFKQQVGIPLGHVLTKQRLCRAAGLLEQSNIRIKEVAYQVGYEHTSSFARAFQRQFGMTPQCYREQSRSQGKLIKSA